MCKLGRSSEIALLNLKIAYNFKKVTKPTTNQFNVKELFDLKKTAP